MIDFSRNTLERRIEPKPFAFLLKLISSGGAESSGVCVGGGVLTSSEPRPHRSGSAHAGQDIHVSSSYVSIILARGYLTTIEQNKCDRRG